MDSGLPLAILSMVFPKQMQELNGIFDEFDNYTYPTDVVLDEPNTLISNFRYPTKEENETKEPPPC